MTRIILAGAVLLALAALDPAESSILATDIQIEGQMADWEAVLRNARNGVVDRASYDNDPDSPSEGQFDLRRLAVTWDDEHLFLHFQRTAISGPTARTNLMLLAYLDLDYDDSLTTSDALLALRLSTALLGDRGLYRYVPSSSADPLPGDGQDVPGHGGVAIPTTIDAVIETATHVRFEIAVRWSDLGVAPGSPIRIQAALANIDGIAAKVSEAVPLLPLGVEDNAEVLDTGEVALAVSAGGSFGVAPGRSIDLPHLLTTSDGNLPQTVELRAIIDDAFALELWTDPDGDGDPSDGRRLARDEDGDGFYLDLGDVLDPGADTTGDLLPDTGMLAVGASFALVVRAEAPVDSNAAIRTLTITAASSLNPAITATTSDELRVSRITLASQYHKYATPGSDVAFSHRLCLHATDPGDIQLQVSASLGWPVTINARGVAVEEVFLAADECIDVTLQMLIPPGAATDATCDIILGAGFASPNQSSSVMDRLTVSETIRLAPDRTGFGLAGSSVFYAHTLRNASPTAVSLDLSAALPFGTGATFWTDPNGDGLPGDGEVLSLTPALAPQGGSLDLLLQIDLREDHLTGDVVSADLSASQAVTPFSAVATDLTTIRLIASYPSAPPATATTVFPGCSTVFVDAGPVLGFPHRLLWYDGNDGLTRVSPDLLGDPAGLVQDSLTLLSTDVAGTWRVELEVDDGSGWAPVLPGGSHELEVQRDLRPHGGLISRLTTDRLDYPPSGATMSITSELTDISPLTYLNSTVRYTLYRDADGDGRPSIGDAAINLSGQRTPWTAASFTCRATGLPDVLPGDSYGEAACAFVGPIDFGEVGEWRLEARWLTECGDVIAARTASVNVGCSGSVAADAGHDQALCEGGSVPIGGLPADPTAGYRWSPEDGLDDPSAAQPLASPLGTTVYSLTVSDPDGCVRRDEVEVTMQPTPVVDAGPSQRVCAGDAVTIGSPSEPGHDYSWSPVSGLDDPTLAQPQASPSTSTTYLLTVSDTATSCSAQAQVVVDVTRAPPADAGPDRALGTSIGPAACDPDLLYEWTPAAGLDDALACNPTATTAREYCLTTRDLASGCASASDCVSVGDVGCPATPSAGADQPTAPAVLGPATCDPTLEYLWTPSDGLDDPTACNPTAAPLTATTYCVTARDPGGGCVSAADCVRVGSGCAVPPTAVRRLDAVRTGDAVLLSWSATTGADGGYHVYRIDARADLGTPGALVFAAAVAELTASDTPGDNAASYYRVVAVCGDGTTEGP